MRAQARSAEELILTADTLPLELRRPISHEEAMTLAVRDAMRAALAGDFAALDELEVACLNLMVRIGDLEVREPDGRTPHWWFTRGGAIEQYDAVAPFVVAYHRGFGADGHAALEWQLLTKCRRCAGKLRREPCRICGGRWYIDDFDDHEVLYTTLEGVLIGEGT